MQKGSLGSKRGSFDYLLDSTAKTQLGYKERSTNNSTLKNPEFMTTYDLNFNGGYLRIKP